MLAKCQLCFSYSFSCKPYEFRRKHYAWACNGCRKAFDMMKKAKENRMVTERLECDQEGGFHDHL